MFVVSIEYIDGSVSSLVYHSEVDAKNVFDANTRYATVFRVELHDTMVREVHENP